MYGPALTALGLVFGIYSADVPNDVQVISTRRFIAPVEFDPVRRDTIQRVRLLVSENRGKNWKYRSDHPPSEPRVEFVAERDGLYWLALQIEYKDGRCEPATVAELDAGVKVYIDTTKTMPAKTRKTHDQLALEVEELKKVVEQLQKRVKELETARKPK